MMSEGHMDSGEATIRLKVALELQRPASTSLASFLHYKNGAGAQRGARYYSTPTIIVLDSPPPHGYMYLAFNPSSIKSRLTERIHHTVKNAI
jgi:hypothetical protein